MTTNQRVLFLDIDEVVANHRAHTATGDWVDPVAMALLGRIVDATGARIVVVSTWRSSPDRCRDLFAAHGLTDALWSPIGGPVDPDDWRVDSDNASRGSTVRRWLAAHPDVGTWAILDDSLADYDRTQLDRLVHVDMDFGLGLGDMSRAVRLLTGRGSDDDGTSKQTRRLTIAALARDAMSAMDQGDHDAAAAILAVIAGHPLAQ